jgi:hypothetical protein
LSTSGIVVPPVPGCLPGFRPEAVREEDRSGLRYGESADGGFDDVVESEPSRRSNSSIRATCAASCADSAVTCPVSVSICTAWVLITSRRAALAFRSRATTSASANDDGSAPDTPP